MGFTSARYEEQEEDDQEDGLNVCSVNFINSFRFLNLPSSGFHGAQDKSGLSPERCRCVLGETDNPIHLDYHYRYPLRLLLLLPLGSMVCVAW